MVWFRRDLRVQDNPALWNACDQAKDGVVGIYLITPGQWHNHNDAPIKIDFWMRNLRTLSLALSELNIPLVVLVADNFERLPGLIAEQAFQFGCRSVFANHEYEVNEAKRDHHVGTALVERKIGFIQYHDRVVIPPEAVKTKDGRFYSVFTPYRRVWDAMVNERLEVFDRPGKQLKLEIASTPIPESVSRFQLESCPSDFWKAGEAEANNRLERFCEKIEAYDSSRDVPGVQGTSLLSPYLAAGVISPRQCAAAILPMLEHSIDRDSGARVWMSELTWRDFYTHVMHGFSRVSKGRPFKLKADKVPWRCCEKDLQAWKLGQTGFPMVDAGMRQLNQTGWMHNRLRMVTAMFLSKNLLIDWRLGEEYFMSKLIDGDLAANNGGWQWCASTGTDSVPYFRIFNPFSQSKRFDPDGIFIKNFCPELESIPALRLHDVKKFAEASNGLSYPKYIVDYKQSRERALAAFKSL